MKFGNYNHAKMCARANNNNLLTDIFLFLAMGGSNEKAFVSRHLNGRAQKEETHNSCAPRRLIGVFASLLFIGRQGRGAHRQMTVRSAGQRMNSPSVAT
jgi:hypothetical protein